MQNKWVGLCQVVHFDTSKTNITNKKVQFSTSDVIRRIEVDGAPSSLQLLCEACWS